MEKFVLVADDDPAILKLLKTVIEGEGFFVVTVSNGKEAYKALQAGADIIAAIVDVKMPYIEGTDLVKFMQSEEKFKKIPVIMMTAQQDPRVSTVSLAAGAVAFLPKPFTNQQLSTTLKMFVKPAEMSA